MVMDYSRWPTLLFDLDGTVADTIPLILSSYDYAIRTVLGDEIDLVSARHWIGRPLADTFNEEYPGQADDLIKAYMGFYSANASTLLRKIDGIDEALAAFRAAGVQMGLATSKRRLAAIQSLQLAGLETTFDVVVAAEDTDIHKPDPAPLLLAAQRLGGEEPVAYIGDAVVDIEAARAAGFDQVAVTWGAGEPDELAAARPTVLATTVAELVDAVLG